METILHVSFFIKGHIMNNNNRQFEKEKKRDSNLKMEQNKN